MYVRVDQEDSWIWYFERNDVFTVKSCYALGLVEHFVKDCSSSPLLRKLSSGVSYLGIPPKIDTQNGQVMLCEVLVWRLHNEAKFCPQRFNY